ncbi:hypothetical protein PR048_009744 [Dryococelus australis]|uniref:Uncharacterized protein n=1 Tax=Dryococelus australis TaxID=614101 RepID=A0ABQ9I0R6_9NEOP|nr:hypothetical protein PR048_009744 [Dryococelus australis]
MYYPPFQCRVWKRTEDFLMRKRESEERQHIRQLRYMNDVPTKDLGGSNSEVLRVDEGQAKYGSSPECKNWVKREIPVKTSRPAASFCTRKFREATRPGIEPDSPRWEASSKTTKPPRPRRDRERRTTRRGVAPADALARHGLSNRALLVLNVIHNRHLDGVGEQLAQRFSATWYGNVTCRWSAPLTLASHPARAKRTESRYMLAAAAPPSLTSSNTPLRHPHAAVTFTSHHSVREDVHHTANPGRLTACPSTMTRRSSSSVETWLKIKPRDGKLAECSGGIGEKWSSTGMRGRGKRDIPEKTHRPAASSGTIPTCENPGVSWSGIWTTDADLPWRGRLVRHRSVVQEALGSNPGARQDKSNTEMMTQLPHQSIPEIYEVDNSTQQRNADVAIASSSHATSCDETTTKQRHYQRKRKKHQDRFQKSSGSSSSVERHWSGAKDQCHPRWRSDDVTTGGSSDSGSKSRIRCPRLHISPPLPPPPRPLKLVTMDGKVVPYLNVE